MLAEVALPQHAIPVALLFFYVGAELGQLIFVAAVLSLIWLLRHARRGLLLAGMLFALFCFTLELERLAAALRSHQQN
jgi:hypothetical protein